MADQAITKKYFQLTFIGCQVGEFDAAAGGCVSELRNRTQMEKISLIKLIVNRYQ